MNEFYSHPGKVFINHVCEIIEIGEKLIDVFGPEKNESKEFYKKILRYFAFFHDLGKLTKDNQEKIKRGEKLQHPHSIYGGIIFRIFCLEKLNLEFSKKLNNKEKRIIYFIIRHHHLDLSNFWEIDRSIENENYKKEYVEETLSSLADFSSLFYSLFSIQIDRILSSIRNNDLSELLEEIKKEEEAINLTRLKNNSTIDDYIDILFISSICFLSDRLSANNSGENFLKEIEKEINIKKYEELEEKIITHISSLHSSDRIDKIRMECHNEIIQRFKNIDIQTARIFKVSLPTGIGKTYIGIRIAISVAKRYNTPIIYSLPFINIIEQIDINFRKIFGNENVEKFHYLSAINTENLEEERIDEFINFKVSPILITTFFQIFTTFFPNSRNSILKFPILVNSCLILDELQSFNPEFYYIFERLIEKIIEKGFRLRLILMSSTLPPLFEESNYFIINLTTTELREKYYNLFNRYKILFKGEIELEKYKEYLLNKIISSDKKRIGIICNKVEEAREVFNFLKEKLNCEQKEYLKSEDFSEKIRKLVNVIKRENKFSSDFKELIEKFLRSIDSTLNGIGVIYSYSDKYNIYLLYLAANLVDGIKMRRVNFLIELMKNLKKGIEIERGKFIVVSTSVIEAGVDFDFDYMFRDFAPFDSLVQSAGRVNRNGRYQPQEIEVWEVYEKREENREKKYSYSPIYSKFLISKTKELIKETSMLEEKDILKVADRYLEKIKYLSKKDCEDMIKGLEFIGIRNDFKFIEDWWSIELILDDRGNIFELYTKIKEYFKSKYGNRFSEEKEFFFKRVLPYLFLLHSKKALSTEEKEELLKNIEEGKIAVEAKKDVRLLNNYLLEMLLFVKDSEFYDVESGFKLTRYENIYIS